MQLNIYLDYQNIHPTQFGFFLPKSHKIYIFIADGQKLPEQTTDQLIGYPGRIKVIRVQGNSKNNLDFHVAFLLGKHHQKYPSKVGFIVVTKDKGFDYLIHYLNTNGRKTIRTEVISKKILKQFISGKEINTDLTQELLQQYSAKLLSVIAKTNKTSRPRKPKRVLNYISSICVGFKDSELIYNHLLESDKIRESQGQIVYYDEFEE